MWMTLHALSPLDFPDFKAHSRHLQILSPTYHYLDLWQFAFYPADLRTNVYKSPLFPSSLDSPFQRGYPLPLHYSTPAQNLTKFKANSVMRYTNIVFVSRISSSPKPVSQACSDLKTPEVLLFISRTRQDEHSLSTPAGLEVYKMCWQEMQCWYIHRPLTGADCVLTHDSTAKQQEHLLRRKRTVLWWGKGAVFVGSYVVVWVACAGGFL